MPNENSTFLDIPVITLSHPTVNGYVRALVYALAQQGALQEFHTTIAMGPRAVDLARQKIRQHPREEHGGVTHDVSAGEAAFSCGHRGELIAHLTG